MNLTQPGMDTLEPVSSGMKFLTADDASSRRGSIPTIRCLQDEDSPGCGRSRSGSIRSTRSRTNSVLTRIPTRPELKTLTRVVKRPAVDIEFTDLTYTVPTGPTGRKHIIKGINGFFRSGEITCIMGPSGAGKSSLMNILVGYVSQGVGGTIYTNGAERQLALFNKLSAYIMQEDLLQPHLTVKESLLVAAHLKLGGELNKEEKLLAVEEIMTTLNLKFCEHTRVERLSGGQKKRLAVALELVNNPPVIFLDEPTTGLDIVTTTQVVSLLKSLARQGRTIVCTLHQPSSTIFHMLDHVYMLAKGLCIYQGSSHKLVPFLAKSGLVCKSTYNPADYVFEILNKTTIKVLSTEIQNGKICWSDEDFEADNLSVKICRQDTLASITPVNLSSQKMGKHDVIFPTSFLQQLWILLCRMILQQGRNMTGFWIQFGHHLAIALMMGLVFQGVGNNAARPFDNFKFLISVEVFFVYTQVMKNVMLMPFEIKILRREYFNRWYGLKSYYTALTLASAPLVILFTVMFAAVTYYLSDQPLSLDRFLWFNLNSILVALVSEATGFCIGTIYNSANGTVVTPAVVAPMLALAVYGMGFGTAVEPYMLFLMGTSFMRHSLVGFSMALWSNGRANFRCPQDVVYCAHEDPRVLLKDLGMSDVSQMNELYILVGYYVVFKAFGYILLKYRLSKSKQQSYNSSLLNYFKKLMKKS